MAITFHPKSGTVLICDFSTGFQPPEMVKRRPVVVMSPRRRHHSGLCLVVPFSTVKPDPVEAVHHLIPVGSYPFFHRQTDVWAKGDMLTCVAFRRLDRVLLNGSYVAPGLRVATRQATARKRGRAVGQRSQFGAAFALPPVATGQPYRGGVSPPYSRCAASPFSRIRALDEPHFWQPGPSLPGGFTEMRSR